MRNLKIEVRNDSVTIDGYVNAVERLSRPIKDARGEYREMIKAGAFQRALDKAENVYVLLDHDETRQLASVKEKNADLYEDNIGLRAKVVITDSEVIEKARQGKLRGWSFGFISQSDEFKKSDDCEIRVVSELDLFEVSLIDDRALPCYVGTSVETRTDGEYLVEKRGGKFEKVEIIDTPEKADYKEFENRLKNLKIMQNGGK